MENYRFGPHRVVNYNFLCILLCSICGKIIWLRRGIERENLGNSSYERKELSVVIFVCAGGQKEWAMMRIKTDNERRNIVEDID